MDKAKTIRIFDKLSIVVVGDKEVDPKNFIAPNSIIDTDKSMTGLQSTNRDTAQALYDHGKKFYEDGDLPLAYGAWNTALLVDYRNDRGLFKNEIRTSLHELYWKAGHGREWDRYVKEIWSTWEAQEWPRVNPGTAPAAVKADTAARYAEMLSRVRAHHKAVSLIDLAIRLDPGNQALRDRRKPIVAARIAVHMTEIKKMGKNKG